MSETSVYTDKATIDVGWTGNLSSLPPIRLIVRAGAFNYQDYLTPEQVRRLAAILTATADAVFEEIEGRPSFDEVVAEKLADKKFVEVSSDAL